MQAVILAGGFGTRLQHVVSDVPKPMAPIKDVPFLEYIIAALKKQGFDNFVFLTGYKAEIIEQHFKKMKNAVFVREEKPLGTGGAILNAYKYLQNEFFVINGDTFFDIDYSILQKFAADKPCAIALRYTKDIKRYGFVEFDENYKLKSFIEKGNLPTGTIDGFINGGIYYIKKSALSDYVNKFKGDFISLETEIFPLLLKNQELFGLPMGGCFIDIGVPQDYFRAQNLIPNWIKKKNKPALFIDKDGTIIVNTEYPHGKNVEFIDSTIDIVKKYYDSGYRIVMVTNQAGIAKGKFNFKQMHENIQTIKKKYAEYGIKFEDVEYCPFHPEGNVKKYKYVSHARKPEPGMILRACEKLKIDLSKSLMLGDNMCIDKIRLPYLKNKIIKGR